MVIMKWTLFLDFADVSWYLTFSFLINKCHRLHQPYFEKLLQNSTKENKNWNPYAARIIFRLVLLLKCYNFYPYVQTLPLWTGGSRFQNTPPVLQFLTEIPRFEMILACMSDIYEFFKSITRFRNSMWKFWLLLTKSRACIAFGRYLSSPWAVDPWKSFKIDTVCNF